ncbi:MAG: DUF4124 domain-containing protein [Burkholderiaceae bacterium]
MVARLGSGFPTIVAICLSLLIAAPASGQWVWKDDAGHMVASDRPPPVGVPQSHIIKEPRSRGAHSPAPNDKDAVAKDPSNADVPKSLADRELDAKLQQKQAAEAAKKAEEEATRVKAMQENCAAVKGNLAALQAGGRAARFNEKGERFYIDDSDRAGEISKAQGQISQYCK